jgi:hypothetical protein
LFPTKDSLQDHQFKALKTLQMQEVQHYHKMSCSNASGVGSGERNITQNALKNVIAEIKHTVVQSGSGANPASYPMGTRGAFPGGRGARA